MVTSQRPSIDFSTFPAGDGTPVAEDRLHLQQMTHLIYSAERHLAPRVRFVVGGNQFIYYNSRNGRQHVAPDVYVALDVEPGMRAKWQTWLEGDKFPEVVFEITSESTQGEDLGPKVALYERLGALEYYIYDPDQLLQPPLRAYHREGARLVEQALQPDLAVHSPALGAELRVMGQWLRLIDPATGQPVPIPEEDYQGRLAAETLAHQETQARIAAELLAHAAETLAQQEARARIAAEMLAQQEARARAEAETLAQQEVRARAEAEAERSRAEALVDQEARARLAAEDALSRMQQDMQAMLAELARLRGSDPH